jgi:predicted RNase H-like HicB family nuclease
MNIPVIVYQDEDGVYIAESPILEWFHTFGRTKEELFKNIEELTLLYKDMLKNKEINLSNKKFLMNYFIDLNFDNVKSSNKLKEIA